jgi:hypothetical protein
MFRWKIAALAGLLVIGCESGSEPQGLDGFEFCGDATGSRGRRFDYNADDSLTRIRHYGKNGVFYDLIIQYVDGHRISETGRGIPPGAGREDFSSQYTYDKTGNLVRSEWNLGGSASCSEYVHDAAARVDSAFECGTGILFNLSILDSLGRRISDTSYSSSKAITYYGTVTYGDSGWVTRSFDLSLNLVEPVETGVYGSRGELRSLRSFDRNDSSWQTTVYTRAGSVETFETRKDSGSLTERGYSDLSPSGKPLKTIECYLL